MPYFIMERLPGSPLHKADLSAAERLLVADETARRTARMHAVANERFGYVQNGLHENWYEAVREMTAPLLGDCRRARRRSRRGERLLSEIDRFRTVLAGAPCRLVSFDLWEPNTLVWREDGALCQGWIDPERSFWGDPLADFVCLDFLQPLAQKRCLPACNAAAVTPVLATPEETVRHAIMQRVPRAHHGDGEVFPLPPLRFGWWRNVAAAGMLCKSAFRTLKAQKALGESN